MSTNLYLRILNNASGKQVADLKSQYGQEMINKMLTAGHIVVLQNGIVTRTELGLAFSKPIEVNEKRNKPNKNFQLLTEDVKTESAPNNQLLTE